MLDSGSRLVSLTFALLMLFAGAARAQVPGDLYGSTDVSSTSGAIIVLDQMTAADSLVGDPTPGPETLHGLDFDSAGRLFATTQGGGASVLLEVDPDTGLSLGTVGPVVDGGGEGLVLTDLAFQPGSDVLYAIASTRLVPPGPILVPDHRLYTIDTTTAVATLVGDPGFSYSGGLAFTPDGTLWATEPDPGASQNVLVTLSSVSGVILTSVEMDRFVDGLGARIDGTLFGTTEGPSTDIVIVDPDGSTTLVGAATNDATDLCFRPFRVDRFQCYQARETRGTPRFLPVAVGLIDQFESIPASMITRPRTLCNPVGIIPLLGPPTGPVDPARHQLCYRMRDDRGPVGKFQRRRVLVINRFGIQHVVVKKPFQLCTPAEKGHVPDPPVPALTPADGYRCYKAKLTPDSWDPSGTPVALADQFGLSGALLRRAFRLCNPVDIDDGGILRHRAHLVCYRLALVPPFLTPGPNIDVNTNDLFGPLAMTVRTFTTRYLCVPSLKLELPDA